MFRCSIINNAPGHVAKPSAVSTPHSPMVQVGKASATGDDILAEDEQDEGVGESDGGILAGDEELVYRCGVDGPSKAIVKGYTRRMRMDLKDI